MADRPPHINFRPTPEDWKLIETAIEFHGGDYPDALRKGLRASGREIEILKTVQKHAAAQASRPAKGKRTTRTRPKR